MEILLSGTDWRFKGFVPYTATAPRDFAPASNWSAWPTATVPGDVQLDLLSIGAIEDPYVDFNSRNVEWVPQRQWAYAKKFLVTNERRGKHVRLVFEGVDYAANFYLNGKHLGYHENLYLPAEFDVTELLNYGDENSVMVVLEPAPDEQPQMGWTSKTKTMKPRMPYGWDFCTRCIPVGIWRDVKLLVTGDAWISDCWADTSLNDDFSLGRVTFRTSLGAVSEMEAKLSLSVGCNECDVASAASELRIAAGGGTSEVTMTLENPALWWPNGCGDQNTYRADVKLLDRSGDVLDERSFTFGFKRVRLLPNPGIPEGLLPWNFEVNGRRTFIKGWNWVPIDHLYGGHHRSRYERLLRLAKEAHVNMLRVWGGGILEKPIFYDLCDRLGIMVWQEFTASSSGLESKLPTNPAFIEMVRKTGRTVVSQRRNHVSHTVWCGGNELAWTGREDAAMAVEREVCERLDPSKIFIPTSPMQTYKPEEAKEIEIHGQWQFLGPEGHYKLYNNLAPAFHSEFGTEGCTNWESVPRFIKDVELWPPIHTKNEIWCHKGEWWANYPRLVELFGDVTEPKTLFNLSQFVQWEGLRYIVESGRRRKYACGGTLPWQFNEPWPNLSCTNAVDFYTIPKHAYYGVRSAYAPVLVSAKYDKLGWRPGETFTAELWITNSGQESSGGVEYLLTDLHGRVLLSGQFSPGIPGNGSRRAGRIEWEVPEEFEELFILRATAIDGTGEELAENYYLFSSAREPIFAPLLHLPQTRLRALGSEQVKRDSETELYISLLNEGDVYAFFVRALPEDNRTEVYFKDNYAIIPPGAKSTIRASLTKPVSRFRLIGWNTQEETIP